MINMILEEMPNRGTLKARVIHQLIHDLLSQVHKLPSHYNTYSQHGAWFTNNMHMVYFRSSLEIPISQGLGSFSATHMHTMEYCFHIYAWTSFIQSQYQSWTHSLIHTTISSCHFIRQIISINAMHRIVIHYDINITHSFFLLCYYNLHRV